MLHLFSDLLESFQRKELLALQQRLIDVLNEGEFDVELASSGVLVKYKHPELSKAIGARALSDTLFVPWLGNDEMVGIIRNGSQKPIFFDSVTKQMNESARANRFIASRNVDEGLKHAVAAGVLAAASLTGSAPKERAELPQVSQAEHEGEMHRLASKQRDAHERNKQEARARQLAQVVADKYAVGSDFALKVAHLAVKHEKPQFPKAEDILAVIGIESSFKPNAQSALKKDPAVGLTQIRPGVWGLNAAKLKGNIEAQVKLGADILHKYYDKLKSADKALHAYNIGLTNYMKQKGLNPRYVQKFDKERDLYETVDPELSALLKYQQEIVEHVNDTEVDILPNKAGLVVTGPGDWFKWKLLITADKGYESGAFVEIRSATSKNTRLASIGFGETISTLLAYEELYDHLPEQYRADLEIDPWKAVFPKNDGSKFLLRFEVSDNPADELQYGFEYKHRNKVLDHGSDLDIAGVLKALKNCLG